MKVLNVVPLLVEEALKLLLATSIALTMLLNIPLKLIGPALRQNYANIIIGLN